MLRAAHFSALRHWAFFEKLNKEKYATNEKANGCFLLDTDADGSTIGPGVTYGSKGKSGRCSFVSTIKWGDYYASRKWYEGCL